VWNDTDEERVVLFLDVVRPLRFPMNVVNAIVLKAIAVSPFIADAKRRHDAWEHQFEAAVAS
jgi:beta-hydroxylase